MTDIKGHSVGLILIEGDKVLLVKNTEKSGYGRDIYGAPAGRLEPDETERHAAAREFNEETGLTTREEDLSEFDNNYHIGEVDRKNGGKETWSIRFFRVNKYNGELAPSEATIPEWVQLNKLKEMELVVNVREAIESAIRFTHRELERKKPL